MKCPSCGDLLLFREGFVSFDNKTRVTMFVCENEYCAIEYVITREETLLTLQDTANET